MMINSNVININALSDLQRFEIFSCLPIRTLQRNMPSFYFRTYKKNQRLFMQGDPRDKIFFLLDGYVMFERCSQDGSTHYLDIIKSKQMFPYGGIFQDDIYQDTAIAVTDVHLFFIQTHILEDLLKTNPKQLLMIIAKLSDILSQHQQRVQKILIPHAQERVLHSLKFLMDDLGVKDSLGVIIPCPLTATHISKLSGTTRETVSLLMNQLKRKQIISVTSKKISILQPDYFNEM
jgi:CRP-like cAMP-binding protein